MATYLELTNELLRRINEVTLDITGDGFTSVRNIQSVAKDAVNSAVRDILQVGKEFPFLKVRTTQTLTAGVSEYSFPTDFSKVDWDTFYLRKHSSGKNSPKRLAALSYEEYIDKYRVRDDELVEGSYTAPDKVYQLYGNGFGVTPLPDTNYVVEYTYWSFPLDMTNHDDVCVIPDRFKHVLISGALVHMMRFRSNDQTAELFRKTFEDGLTEMRRVLLDERTSLRSTMIQR